MRQCAADSLAPSILCRKPRFESLPFIPLKNIYIYTNSHEVSFSHSVDIQRKSLLNIFSLLFKNESRHIFDMVHIEASDSVSEAKVLSQWF
jgi:hypothetical protein